MKQIIELLNNEAYRWCVMAAVIFALTFAFKIPYKKLLTDRIKDETKRKIANKAIVIFTIGLGVFLEFVWCYWHNIAFDIMEFGYGIKHGLSAIALYSALEIRIGKKIENPFENEESQKVIADATEFVDAITNKTKKDKKTKKKQQTAEEKFWNLVGQDNAN